MFGERNKLSTAERAVLVAFYLFLGGMGAMTMKHSTDPASKLAHFEQLQQLTATDFKNSVPGHQVVIEGHVSKHTPVQFRQFVAYIRQEYQGKNDTGSRWSEAFRVTPPLLLALPDGLIQIKNNDYNIERFSIIWQEGTERYLGFKVSNPVLAVGVVVQGVEGKALEAKWIYGGTSAEYINDLRMEQRLMFWFGLSMLVTGVIAVKLLV
jgi:hypothetical protein